jgi:drug/metabolite transporter (DMT)-like permease
LTGSLLVAAAAALWGLWPLWVRYGGGGAIVAAVALVVAGACGLPLALREGRVRGRRPPAAWALLALLGVVDAANVWLYFRALAEGAVAPGVLAHYLAPVLVALAAPTLLGEPRAPRTPLALGCALAGTAALVLSIPDAGGGGAAARHAVVFGATSALFYAAAVLLSKRLAREFGDAELLAYHVLLAGLLIVPACPAPAPAKLVAAVAGGLVSTLVAGLLYYAGLRRIPAERAGILAYLEPLVAVLVGWAAFGEAPAPIAAAGGALILAGGALAITRAPPN